MFDFLFFRSKGSQYMRAALLSTMLLSSACPLFAMNPGEDRDVWRRAGSSRKEGDSAENGGATGGSLSGSLADLLSARRCYDEEEGRGGADSATNDEGKLRREGDLAEDEEETGSFASAKHSTFSLAYPLWSREGFNKEEGDFAARGGAPSAENPLSEREETPSQKRSRSVLKDPNVGLKNSSADLAYRMLPSVVSLCRARVGLPSDGTLPYIPQPGDWEKGRWEGAVEFFKALFRPRQSTTEPHHPRDLLDELIEALDLSREVSSDVQPIKVRFPSVSSSVGWRALVSALSSFPALTALNLRNISISSEAATAIGKALPSLRALRTLNLSQDIFWRLGQPTTPVIPILRPSGSCGLTNLDISGNSVSYAGPLEQLQGILLTHTALTALNLANTYLFNTRSREFARALSNLGGLRTLNLSRNNLGGWLNQMSDVLSDILKLSQLTNLDISSNGLHEGYTPALARALPRLTNLTELNLRNNPIFLEMTPLIKSAFSRNRELRAAQSAASAARPTESVGLSTDLDLRD